MVASELNVKLPSLLEQLPQEFHLSGKIEAVLREKDSGQGVEFDEIIKLLHEPDYQVYSESDIDDKLFELAYEGKVYQPRPDFYKIMD